VSRDETPTLYVATFRPVDHAVMLWSYRDAGGPPHQPAGGVPAAVPPPPAGHAGQARPAPPMARGAAATLLALAVGPEAPYLGVGAAAFAVVLVALVAYIRRGRRL
jgi:hypothetical protein